MYELEELCPGHLFRTNSTGQLLEDRNNPVWQFDSTIRLSGRALEKIGLPVNIQFDSDSVAFRLRALGGISGTQDENSESAESLTF